MVLALEGIVQNTRQKGGKGVSADDLRGMISDLHRTNGAGKANLLVDCYATWDVLSLENTVIVQSDGRKIFIPGPFQVTWNLDWDGGAKPYFGKKDFNGEYTSGCWITAWRNGQPLNGNFEVNGVYHSFGELGRIRMPFTMAAENARLTFQSKKYAVRTSSTGDPGYIANGTFELQPAVFAVDGINQVSYASIPREQAKEFEKQFGKAFKSTGFTGVSIGMGLTILGPLALPAVGFGLKALYDIGKTVEQNRLNQHQQFMKSKYTMRFGFTGYIHG